MRVFKNETLKGRKEVKLTIPGEQNESKDLTFRVLVQIIALNGLPKEELTLPNMRKVNKIMDQVEKEDEEKSETVSLEDDWHNLVQPHFEKFLTEGFRVHAPAAVDMLATLEIKEPLASKDS